MNEEPKSIWNRPWKGPRGYLLWFALLAGGAAVVIYAFGSACRAGTEIMWAAAALLLLTGTVALLGFLFLRSLCGWRNPRRVLFGLVCLVTLIALFYAEENVRGKWAWEKFKREWEAKGERFDIASIIPPPVPDEQNFAMTPLLRPAMDFVHGTNGTRLRDTNGYAHLEQISIWTTPPGRTNMAPDMGSLEKGTLTDLEAWQNFYRGNTNYPQPLKPGTAAEDVLTALGKFDADLKELQNAAATRPYSRFPTEYTNEMPFAILLPHLTIIKALCTVAELRATARLEAGQPGEALEDLKLGFRLLDSIRDEPILIDHLVRLASLNFVLQTLREGLFRHAWNDAQLARIEKHLAPVNVLAEYKHAMRGERALCITAVEYYRRQGFKANPGELYGGDDANAPLLLKFAGFLPGGWYHQNMLSTARLFQNFLLPAVDDQKHRVSPELAESVNNICAQQRTTPYNTFTKLLGPGLGKASRRSARMQSCVDEARVACALERYRLANSQLPDTLDALVPRFIEKIPNDVIDGKPLRYRKNSDGSFVIYSIGWNQTDDGGDVVWKKGGKNLDPEKGDWVWRLPK